MVRQAVQFQQSVEPIHNQRSSFLSSDEVVLVWQVPLRLGVVLGIYFPLKDASPLRMIVHDYFRKIAISVVNVVAGILADVGQPV